ncbi:aminoacyl-histidine dipeptidase [Mariniphaga sediminis]|uniref:Cytosol non-specific dipeptidase n=1 Tax=Mariniphaga sediminis TaxID=1628158 RepID=A0A399CXG2_9BACT|nr:aminoacyl-histidine dipeptidase [Mariniphaga sediminis]RIH63853.1 aminoacyl-histidine dipeptidase [Mariniphaga sediminis]
MNKIKDIQPAEVWGIFDQILQIPRPSNHEEKIQDWAVRFGNNLGLETLKDEAGNVVIRKPATPGMETRKGVILQGHLDMVPQKNSDKEHDFISDPIDAFIDGEWVTANGTTLGADNGIGVSAALAVLSSKNLKHGPLEVLLTATEETGMDGANGLKAGVLKGEILINTDSEDEGELYVGCAGGEDATALFSYTEEEIPAGFTGIKMSVTGMKGGHSGMDIALGRGNANKVFFRILNAAGEKLGVRLASIDGGGLRNAIPREAFGVLAVSEASVSDFAALVDELTETIKHELSATEPDLKVTIEQTEFPAALIDKKTQESLTMAVVACPNGVIRMSDSMKGLVETSTNLAIIKSDTEKKTILCAALMRSSVDSAKEDLASRIKAVFELAGAKVTFSGSYPGWKPNMDSAILKTMQEVYHEKFGKIPEIKAIHAGLECGILGGKYPGWDMISFGPTIRFPHSPDEKVNVETVQKFWDFMKATLENIPEK